MTELTVQDPSESAAWYRDVLGFKINHIDEANGFYHLALEGAGLSLKRGQPHTSGLRLHFEVEDLSAELTRLLTLGVAPIGDLKTSHEGYRRAVLQDPDGYGIVLFEWLRDRNG